MMVINVRVVPVKRSLKTVALEWTDECIFEPGALALVSKNLSFVVSQVVLEHAL
jgi:hypothetical protein